MISTRKVDTNFIQQPFQLEVRRMKIGFVHRKWGDPPDRQMERPRLTYGTESGFLRHQTRTQRHESI